MAGIESGVKIHTVRQKPAKPGETLFLRSGRKVIKKVCDGVQEIEIHPAPYGSVAYVSGKILGVESLTEFAINGGFKSAGHAIEYYGDGFKGYIIHWTSKRY